MPAPTQQVLEQFLTSNLITQGITKKTFDSDGAVTDTGQLTDEMTLIVKGLAAGISQVWEQWQAAEVVAVTIPVTASAGSPSTGTGVLT